MPVNATFEGNVGQGCNGGIIRRLVLIAACFAFAGSMAAQSTLQKRPAVPDYVLGVGDEVLIRIVDLDDIPDKPMRIDPNGLLDLPLVGEIQASGKTLGQLKKRARGALWEVSSVTAGYHQLDGRQGPSCFSNRRGERPGRAATAGTKAAGGSDCHSWRH